MPNKMTLDMGNNYTSHLEFKACTKCGEIKPLDEFWVNKAHKTGRDSRCILCKKKVWSERPGRPRKGRREYVSLTEKYCKGCEKTLPSTAFDIRYDRANGKALKARCISCNSASHKAWREKNPGASRDRNLKSKYNIGAEDYLKLLDNQNGGCGICGSTDSGWSSSPWLHVDHNHETGEIRGLLCHGCNILIGCIEKAKIKDMSLITNWLNR